MQENNELERGPILTPQIIIVILFIIGVPVVSLIFSGYVTEEKPSFWGKYKGDQSSRTESEELPNRKPEGDRAVEDVDFDKVKTDARNKPLEEIEIKSAKGIEIPKSGD